MRTAVKEVIVWFVETIDKPNTKGISDIVGLYESADVKPALIYMDATMTNRSLFECLRDKGLPMIVLCGYVEQKKNEAIKINSENKRAAYNRGVAEVERTIEVISVNIEQNKTLEKHIIKIADTLLGGKMPDHLVKRIFELAGLCPGATTLTVENGTAKV